VEIGRLHHLQTVGIGTARWFVLRGVVVAGLDGYRSEKRATPLVSPWWWLASVGLNLRKEPWVSLWWWLASLTGGGGGKLSEKKKKKKMPRRGSLCWWFQVVAAEKRKKKFWRVGLYKKVYLLVVSGMFFNPFRASAENEESTERRDRASAENEESTERRESTE
jgi:hypothetical protein